MAKVGKKTGKKTQAGKDVYKTPEGKNVSEISSTFEYKGKWINVPSIHKGYEYDDDTLRLMLEAGVIKPTSVHDSRTEAEAEAEDRSDRLKFDEGGLLDENSQGLLDFLSKFNPLTADYRKEEPTSVKTMRGATSLTPLDSVVEIGKELNKEEPDYKKIGLLTAMEAAGAVAPMAKPVLTAVKSSKAAQPFKKTRKAYRIATQAEDGKLYPLFVNADDEIPVGQWISASIPPITFKGKNGNMYVPSKGAKRSKGEKAKPTGDMQVLPDQETADKLREAGFAVEKPSKAAPFGKVRAVASRPGYHATTKPVAHHLGPEDLIINEAEKNKLIKAGITPKAFKEKTFNYLDGKLISKKKIADLSEKEKKRVTKQKKFYVKRRAEDQVFLEVDMADDTSEELLSYMNARGRTDINDKLPEGGSYTYQDGQADAETWVVGGDMKVNRVLDRDEALTIQKKMGVKDLPLRSEVEDILERNFSNGGLVEEGIDMYQGQDDSLLVEGIGMAKGGTVEEQMEMSFGEVPDNTIGIDPVSGNEIPMGSTAENVRDDIPANLSEGEIVVAADVVNFHGVKLFEDLRAEAKMGYAQMAEDGRMGGEPMEDDMEMENDIGLDFADLETMEVPDDAEPVEMRRGGRSMADYRGVTKNRNIKPPKRSGPRKTHEQIMAQIRGGSSPSDSRPAPVVTTPTPTITVPTTTGPQRPNLITQPPTTDNANIGNSIAQQINMYDKDFRENPVEQKSTAERLADIRKRNQERYQGAGYVDKARDFVGGLFGFGDEQEKEGPQRFQIGGDADYGFSGGPLERAKRKGLGPKFDEGGMATDNNLIGGTDQFNQPFYAPDQKGGFDMNMAYPDQASGGTGEPVLEMREYMNDQGHRMFITFIDGEPQMEIPAGYYPVGETTTMQPVGITGTTTANYGTSSQNDDPGVEDMVMPEGINYKELSLEELQNMIEDQKSFGSKVFRSLSPVTRLVMWDQTRRTKAELERRRDDPYTSEVDKRRYDTLLELANRDEPGLVSTLLNKITGKEPDVPQARTPEQTSALYSQLDKMTKAYTPDVQTANDRTTPGVDTDRGFTPTNVAPPAATTTTPFIPQSSDADDFDKMQDRFDIERIEAEMKAQERPVKTPTTPIRQTSPRVQQARQNTQKVMQDMRDRGASREERTQSLKAAARTENVLRDLDRGVVRGFEKGGLASKKKGRKKKSK